MGILQENDGNFMDGILKKQRIELWMEEEIL